MKLSDIAIKNILRRKSRAVFIMLGIFAGVGSVVAVKIYTSAMTDQISHRMEKYGANIIILPKSDSLNISYGGLTVGNVSWGEKEITAGSLKNITRIKNAANIAAAGPLLIGSSRVSGKAVLIAGMDFTSQKILKPWWKLSGKNPGGKELIAGKKAAVILNLKSGDTLRIGNHLMRVSGVLDETGSQDDDMLFMNLATAQSILGKAGKISMVEVAALCNACPITEMVSQISEKLPDSDVMALQQVVSGRINTINQMKNVSLALSAVIMAVGTFVVFVTMMGNVRERKSEIGILRAIGYRRSHIILIILLEAAFISVTGGVLGFITGYSTAGIMAAAAAGGEHLMIHSGASGVFSAVFLAMVTGIMAGFYPALAASKLDPAEALKSI